MAAIGGGSADVVNRGEWGQMIVEDGGAVAGGADQGLLQGRETLGGSGTGADGNAGGDDAAVGVAGDHGGDHGDGDDQVAPGTEFQETRSSGVAGAGDTKTEQKLVGEAGGFAGGEEETGQRKGAGAGDAGQDDLGFEGQQAGDAVGGGAGVADVAGEGGDVLDLAASDLAGGLFQAVEGGRKAGFDDVGPGGQAGNPPVVRTGFDPTEVWQRREVEDGGVGWGGYVRGVEVGAAGEGRAGRIRRAHGQGCERRVKRRGSEVAAHARPEIVCIRMIGRFSGLCQAVDRAVRRGIDALGPGAAWRRNNRFADVCDNAAARGDKNNRSGGRTVHRDLPDRAACGVRGICRGENAMNFYVIAAVAALGGLLFGYDTGVISGALLFIRQVMSLTPTVQGMVVAIALAGAAISASMAGTLSDRFGRRRVILGAGLLFIAGALLSAVAQEVTILLVGRFLVGLVIGVASMLTPLYLARNLAGTRSWCDSVAESALHHRRDTGVVPCRLRACRCIRRMALDAWLRGAPRHHPVGRNAGAPPESYPRWLAGHNQMDDAKTVLQRLRGSADVSDELNNLRTDLALEGRRPVSARGLLAPRLRRPLIIGIGLAMFQQITGINTVIYFAPTIFQTAGMSSAATSILATAGVGAVNVIMTIVSIRLIDSLGRRQLLFWSLGGMAITLFVLSAAFHAGASGQLAWIAVVSVAAYVGFFAIGLGPIFWLLIAEIFPLALRGRAMSLSTVANWGFNLIVSATFLNLVGAFGSAAAFLVYAILSLTALAFVAVMVPETKGRSLEQIEEALDGTHPPSPFAKQGTP